LIEVMGVADMKQETHQDHILVVEDNREFNDLMSNFLKASGFAVTQAFDGDDALELLAEQTFDLVLLDVMMPCRDGFSVCRELRAISSVPVIFITALSAEEDSLTGYRAGGDDFMSKPFSLTVLVAKARALIARSRGSSPGHESLLIHHRVTIDPHARLVTVDGEPVSLRPKEYEILMVLMQNRGRVVPRERLLSLLWGFDYGGDERVLDRQIQTLRERLKSAGRLIATVYGVGYRLEQEEPK